MIIRENVLLAPLTTFGIEARAAWHISLESPDDVRLWAVETSCESRFADLPAMPLGGGSNVLFARDFDSIILGVDLHGREIVSENETSSILRIRAGENWHNTVEFCMDNGLFGIENLALIPGKVGAAPIQNIGAYGVEIEKFISSVEYFDTIDKRFITLRREDCLFGYRNSIFKSVLKSRHIITAVTLALSKIPRPAADYADLRRELESREISNPSPHDIFEAVIAVRKRKLPDPHVIGNAGSFFKNPIISAEKARKFIENNPESPRYPQSDGSVKISAAWLIDHAGWKGFRRGAAGVSPVQALILVNYGGATGKEIVELARDIRLSVAERFGIDIEPEVNILG